MPPARLPDIPPLGPDAPHAGGPFSRALGRVALRVLGWHIEGSIPNLPKFVIIVAPHTSNWDFPVGVAVKLALGLNANYLGKDSLFRFPLGPLMRALGGMPVDRSTSNEVVSSIVAEFRRRERIALAITPEGTRKRVERWRTGFYHIAHAAGVPIVPVAFNWGKRAVQIGAPFTTTGSVDTDLPRLQALFAGIEGRRKKS